MGQMTATKYNRLSIHWHLVELQTMEQSIASLWQPTCLGSKLLQLPKQSSRAGLGKALQQPSWTQKEHTWLSNTLYCYHLTPQCYSHICITTITCSHTVWAGCHIAVCTQHSSCTVGHCLGSSDVPLMSGSHLHPSSWSPCRGNDCQLSLGTLHQHTVHNSCKTHPGGYAESRCSNRWVG